VPLSTGSSSRNAAPPSAWCDVPTPAASRRGGRDARPAPLWAHPEYIPNLPGRLGCPALCSMKGSHDDVFGMTLNQQVVRLLALRRGHWCCDRCLSLALDRPEQHGVQFITDALAANGGYSRSWRLCADCQCEKLVTMAS
jgi:hypothetical protein